MSNLGKYQVMTTMAKKAGGPGKLLVVILAVGYAAGKAVEKLGKAGYSYFKEWKRTKGATAESEEEYTVLEDGVDDQGLKFTKGDVIHVLEKAEDAVLIEKVGDDNNPYFVSEDFLKRTVGYEGY